MAAEYRFASVEIDGHLMIVTIRRPEVMNALHPPANFELEEIFDRFERDEDLWVAIVTAEGDRAFSAGNDLRFAAELAARGEPLAVPKTGFGGITARFTNNKPIIAAVNGIAMGGGFEVALACDIIIAADTASFALPEARVGLAALAGGLLRLPRVIGVKRAMGMILTGRRISAQEGLQFGFVNAVVPRGELLDEAKRWAADILACSPMSIRAAKDGIMAGLDAADLEGAYRTQKARVAMKAMIESEDALEGPRAFSEKRAPQWKGR